MKANQNFVNSELEEKYLELPNSNLESIMKENSGANKKLNKSGGLAGLTILSAFAMAITSGLFNLFGHREIADYMDKVAFPVVVGGVSLPSIIYYFCATTGKGYNSLVDYNTSLNILNKRKEVPKLMEKYSQSLSESS